MRLPFFISVPVVEQSNQRNDFSTLCFRKIESRFVRMKSRKNLLKQRFDFLILDFRKSNLDVVILLSSDRT